MILFCDDRAAAFWFCMAELTTGSPRESYDRRETACLATQKIVRILHQKWTCRETGLQRYGCRTTSKFSTDRGLAAALQN